MYASSVAVYGETKLAYQFETDIRPISSYGLTKLTAEEYIKLYAEILIFQPVLLRFSQHLEKGLKDK